MIYQQLGNTDMQISALSLGGMSFHTLKDGRAIITKALDHGINYFDTADLYDKGNNEKVIGEVLKDQRQDIILATKVGNRWRADGSGWDWVPRKAYIMKAVEASLKRLQTDYIDLYQLHGGTVDDPLEEVVEAFELLQTQGKIKAYGISSIRPNTIRKWTKLSRGQACMTQYSMLDRRPEEATLDHLAEAQQSVLVRGVLAKGILAGKAPRAYLGHTLETVAAVQDRLHSNEAAIGLAVAYALVHPAVTTVVLGASNAVQLESVILAWEQQQSMGFDLNKWKKWLPLDVYQAHR
jgi:aryl-alcohol dehydrogenase-like predicted oxidoreductase